MHFKAKQPTPPERRKTYGGPMSLDACVLRKSAVATIPGITSTHLDNLPLENPQSQTLGLTALYKVTCTLTAIP